MKFCPQCGESINLARPFQCPNCETWQWLNPKPCAGVLIEYQNKVLLLRRALEPWKGHWDIPGGFCDGGEHPRDAAVREVKEELGIDVELVGLLGMWMDTYGEGERPDTTLNIYYVAHWHGEDPPVLRLDATEASSAKWFAADSLPDDIGFPRHMPDAVAAWAAVAVGKMALAPIT